MKPVTQVHLELVQKNFHDFFRRIVRGPVIQQTELDTFIKKMNVDNMLMHAIMNTQGPITQEESEEILRVARSVDNCSKVFEYYLENGKLPDEIIHAIMMETES